MLNLFSNPKIIQMLQVLSNSNNPIGQMDAMFGNDPKYLAFKKEIDGKNQQEVLQYFTNKFNAQGINVDNIVNIARQFGLIK